MPRKPFCLLVSLLLMLQSGCWSATEPSDLTLAAAIGIDSEQQTTVTVWYELVNPTLSEKAGGDQQSENATRVLFESARSIPSAINVLATKTGKNATLGQATCLILGEGLSRRGISPVVDYVLREPDIRTSVHLVVTDENIGTLLNSQVLRDTAATEITGLLRNGSSTGFTADITALDVARDISLPGIEPVAPMIGLTALQQIGVDPDQASEDTMMTAERIAVFRHDRLLGVLTPPESRGLVLMRNKVRGPMIDIAETPTEAAVTVRINQASPRLGVSYSPNGVSSLSVEIKVDAEVTEKTVFYERELRSNWIAETEQRLSRLLQEQISSTLRVLQTTYETDSVGFGLMVYRHRPDLWRKYESDWNRTFAGLPFEVVVSVKIRATGNLKAGPAHIVSERAGR